MGDVMETRRPGPTGTVKLGWVPKEHGVSFMSVHALLLGIVAGLAAGGHTVPGLLLAIAFECLFLPLVAAVSVWSHPRFAAAARRRVLVFGVAFALLGLLALLHGPVPQLLSLAVAGVVVGGVYALVRVRTGPRSVLTQLAAIAGISLLAPLAWLLVAGATARWPLSGPASFLAFGGTVPYVRERVRRRSLKTTTPAERLRRGAPALLWQAAAVVASSAAAITGLVNPLVAVAFLPGAVKTFVALARPETRPPIKHIGYLETALSTVFAVLAGIGLGIAPST